jgi:uncharacterized membrane protein YjdF
MAMSKRFSITYLPPVLTAILIVWTICISPVSKYGDNWALAPAIAVLPALLAVHLVLAHRRRWRMGFVAYGVIHCAFACVILLWSLSLISKDSL